MALIGPDTQRRRAAAPRAIPRRGGVAIDSTALEERFVRGDPTALREAYDRWGAMVLAVADQTLGNRHDAEDAVQEAFVAAWRNRSSFDPGRGSLPGWLTGIIKNKVKDGMRTRGRAPAPIDPAGLHDEGHTGEVDRVADVLLVRDALGRLPLDQRNVLELSFFDGRSHTDIATQLDLPLGTVKSHARRGLQALQRHLGDDRG